MPLTAQTIIDGARARHPAFHAQRVPDPVLVARLGFDARQLQSQILQRNRYALRAVATALPPTPGLVNLGAGVICKLLLGGTVHLTSGEVPPLRRVAYNDRMRGLAPWAVYEVGGQVYLDGIDQDWDDVSTVDIDYVPEIALLTKPTDAVALPDACYTALVALTALGAALHASGLEKPPANLRVQDFAAQASGAVSTLLDELALRKVGAISKLVDPTT